MWAQPRSGDGRWIIAQRPPMRRGNSAASLSSGGIDRAEPADAPEVAGHRQRDERPAPAVRRVGDRPFLALGQPGQARVLAAPDLLGVAVDVRARAAARVEAPVRDAVARCARRGAGRSRAGPRRGPAGSSRSPTRAAPGLKTEFAGYGTSAAVRIGFAARALEEPDGAAAVTRGSDERRAAPRSRAPASGRRAPRAQRADVLERRSATSASTRRPGSRSRRRASGRRSTRRARGSAIAQAEVVRAEEPRRTPRSIAAR